MENHETICCGLTDDREILKTGILKLLDVIPLGRERLQRPERHIRYMVQRGCRWRDLRGKGWAGMTDAEQAEWLAGLKSAYNAMDFNRVTAAMEYLADRWLRGGLCARGGRGGPHRVADDGHSHPGAEAGLSGQCGRPACGAGAA